MSNNMKWSGLLALFSIIIVIPLYAWLEPAQQGKLLTENRTSSIVSAADQYAQNCVVCHGAGGEGIGDSPALNTDGLRSVPSDDLMKVIARGRYGTLMAPWAVDEGGVLSSSQVDNLVTLIQYGNWEYVEGRVAELGLTPPQVIEFEVTQEMLSVLDTLPEGDQLGEALIVFAENCAACHNANGSGTLIAPALDSPDLRGRPDQELVQVIRDGVPGTLMAGWSNALSTEQIESMVKLIDNWPDLIQAGFEFPETEMSSLPSSPEIITAGDQLFNIACKSCHGLDAYGSPMAPALNNQIFLSQTPDAAIYQIIAAGVPGTRMPAWGSRLTDADIQSLVAYLRSLEITAPPIVPPILDGQ